MLIPSSRGLWTARVLLGGLVLSLLAPSMAGAEESAAEARPVIRLAQGYGQPDGSYNPPPNRYPNYGNGGQSFGNQSYGNAPPPSGDYGGGQSGGGQPYGNPNYGGQTYGNAPAPQPQYGAPSYGAPSGGQTYAGRPADDAYHPAQPRYEPQQPYPAPSYGRPYEPADRGGYDQPPRRDAYNAPPPYSDDYDSPRDGTFSAREIRDAGHGFFGSISQGLASVIEYAFRQQGRPNGYILGEDLGGAFVAGLRYGEGTLYTKDAGVHKVYWQGPSIGYDAGAEGSKVMVLVYNLHDPQEIYQRFGGVAGSAYVVGGVGLTFQSNNDVVLAPIRSGIGLRLGANIGYLKYTRRPTWNPF